MMTDKTFWTIERFVNNGIRTDWRPLFVGIESEAKAFELFDKAKSQYSEPLRLTKTVCYVLETHGLAK
jgi:hypothetical protein